LSHPPEAIGERLALVFRATDEVEQLVGLEQVERGGGSEDADQLLPHGGLENPLLEILLPIGEVAGITRRDPGSSR
jgi:hypothetical protein